MSTRLYVHAKSGKPVPAKYLEIDGKVIRDPSGNLYKVPAGFAHTRKAAGWLLSFCIPFLFIIPLRAEELYTRTDELSCGNTVVQAFTTCTENSHDLDTAVCTEQHFLFINKKTGAVLRVEGSGEPTVDRYVAGGKTWVVYDGLARDWACLEGARSYVFIGYTQKSEPEDGYSGWEELLDLKGRRLASNREIPFSRWSGSRKAWVKASRKVWHRFHKVWNSTNPGVHPLPTYEFVPIQIFKTNRIDLSRP
jgi:hypothetical protein